MVRQIITNRLNIAMAQKGNLLRFSLLPCGVAEDGGLEDVTVICYNAENVETDVDIMEMIGIINGETTWRHLYMNGGKLEESDLADYFEYRIPIFVYLAPNNVILDEFTVKYQDLVTVGVAEKKFIADSLLTSGSISMKTLMRLEALKYARLYFSNMEAV